MTETKPITAARLREVLNYDPEAGIFTWRISNSNRASIGAKTGGALKHGYHQIGIDGHDYRAHRLAWLYVTGAWPKGPLDHINRIRSDNRFCNLRLATKALNNANSLVRGQSGLKGAYQHECGIWQAKIKAGSKNIFLGSFATPEEAHAAYCRATAKYFGEFANGDCLPKTVQLSGRMFLFLARTGGSDD